MSDYRNTPQEGEVYKDIVREQSKAWAGWRYIDRAKASMTKCPAPYGTKECSNWSGHLSKLLGEMPALQTLVDAYHARTETNET